MRGILRPMLQIIHHPHPTLRHKSKPVRRVDAELKAMVAEMFTLMYEARGIGLAANQVNLPLRLFVMNLTADPNEGEELVFINPVISRPTGHDIGEEGCLSLPQVFGPVLRPAEVMFTAYNLQGEKFEQKVDGMFARCVQHETDHLDGIMFFERMGDDDLLEIERDIAEFELSYDKQKGAGKVPSDEEVARHIAELEAKYC